MKHLSFTLTAVFFFFFGQAFAQENERYTEAMKKGLELIQTAESPDAMTTAANHFERIAETESDKWLPGYYAAYCLTMQSFMIQDGEQKDEVLDVAQEWIDKITAIDAEESEIYALQAMIYQARIQVDVMRRGPEMSMLQMSALEEAEDLNEDNPRVYFLRGQNTYYTPKFFGGGAKAAKPILDQAKEKYDAFEAEDELAPNWGGDRVVYLLSQYEEE